MSQDKRFENKVAIVTGAASGIGLATAKRMGQEGAWVVLVDRDEQKTHKAADEVKAAGAPKVLVCTCDVSKPDDVTRTAEQTMSQFGRIDVIVNNAGRMIFKSLEDHTMQDWHDILSVDLLGAFLFIQQGFKYMKPGSAIVNVASIHAIETTPNVTSYAAAKAAILSLTRSASIEGKPKGIRTNAILPGAIDTPMLWQNPNIKDGLETISTSDVGKPEDIAATIASLASDDCAFVQGAALNADGGRLAKL